jgi:hypothetical protein
MYPTINERIGEMSEMRNQVCERLPLHHPFQPQVIQPLNMVVPDEVNVEPSSSQPPSINQTEDTTVIDNLVSHYTSELPEVRPNLEKASEVTSEAIAQEEVTSENPQQQPPNPQMTSTINPAHVSSSEHVSTSEHVSISEPVVPEHIVPEQLALEQTQSSTIHIPKTAFKPTCIDNRVTIATFMDTDSEDDQDDPQSSNMDIDIVCDQPSASNPQSTND